MDLKQSFDGFIEGTEEVMDVAHEKTEQFHENYVSKIIPDFGKYGDEAKFVAEMLPGVAEYNAIEDGDWQAFAISAGIDIGSLAIGAATVGTGYAAAKTGARLAMKEVAEAGAEKVVKEVAEAGAEKVVKEVAEAGAEKAVKEVAEAGAEKAVKEVAEEGAEKVVKEAAEAGTEKAIKEMAEEGTEKAIKEMAEEGTEKATKEVGKEIKNIKRLNCKNEKYAGSTHPITGVPFFEKIVSDGNGEFVEGVFPKFDSVFDAHIDPKDYLKSNYDQFKKCNQQLLDSITMNPSLKEKFTPVQIEQIKDGIVHGAAPDGYVWHHNEKEGVLQLVSITEHLNTAHSGGRIVWGGGY